MINGYVNLPDSVKNIIENFFNNNIKEGNLPGIYNKLVSLPDKPLVTKIHIDKFLGITLGADFVIHPIMVKQDSYIDIQAFLFIPTPITEERLIIAVAATIMSNDDFIVELGLFQQLTLGG